MSHGPHDNCTMCKMARAIGMMEKHPKGCNCEGHPRKKDEREDEIKANAAV